MASKFFLYTCPTEMSIDGACNGMFVNHTFTMNQHLFLDISRIEQFIAS